MLDLITVITYNAVINVAVLVVATVAWVRNPCKKEIVLWALAAWFMVIGAICSSLTEHVPYNIMGYIGGLIYVARMGVMCLGFKEFYGQPYRLWHGAQIAVPVCIAMVLAGVLEDPTPKRISLIYLGSAINLTLCAHVLWRAKAGERLSSGRLAAAIFAVYAFSSFVIAPLAILYPVQFVGRVPVSDWMTYTSMLLLIFNLLSFLMAMVLMLERSGEIQRQLAERDTLTGLLNRRMFLHQAEDLARIGKAAIAIIDLDHFKRINDTYGHKGGDDALLQFSTYVRETLPPNAIFGRLGGEEFGICLPGHDLASAQTVLETVITGLASTHIRSGEHVFRLTFSGGVTVMNNPARSLDAWMADADMGLYAAKEGGRNRVVAFQPKPAPGPIAANSSAESAPARTFG